MIASFIPGRVRLRSNALKNPKNMQSILDLAKGFEGISSLTPNPLTGSILVLYDPEVISEEMLAQAAEAFAAQFPEEDENACDSGIGLPYCLKGRRGELNLLLSALGLTIGGLAFGTRAHAIIGGLFTLLSIKHVYDRKEQML